MHSGPQNANQAQEHALRLKLIELCQAASDEQIQNSKQVQGAETKAEHVARDRALNYISTLGEKIQMLRSDFDIYQGNIYQHQNILLDFVISHRLGEIYYRLVFESTAKPDQPYHHLHLATLHASNYLYRMLYTPQAEPQLKTLLTAALNTTASQYKEDQEKIVSDLLFVNAKVTPFLSKENLLEYIKLTVITQNTKLINKLLQLFPAGTVAGERVLIDLIDTAELTPQNRETIETIVSDLIQYLVFTEDQLHSALLIATQRSFRINAPNIIHLLNTKGAKTTLEELTKIIPEFIFSNKERNATKRAQSSQVITALVAAGGELNPNPQTGNKVLHKAMQCTDAEPLETILNLSFFYPEQLNNSMTTIIRHDRSEFINTSLYQKCRKILALLQHGADPITEKQSLFISQFLTMPCSIKETMESSYSTSPYNQQIILTSEIKQTEDIISQILHLIFSTQSKETLRDLLSSHINTDVGINPNKDFDIPTRILKGFLATGTEPYYQFTSGETLLVYYVKKQRPACVKTILSEQKLRGQMDYQNGSFKYRIRSDKTLSLYFNLEAESGNGIEEFQDLFLLANAHAETIAVLMEFNIPVTTKTLSIYQSLNDERKIIDYAAAYQTLEKYQKTNPEPELADSIDDEQKGSAQLTVRPRLLANKAELSFEKIKELTATDLLTITTPSILTKAINTLLDTDIALQSENKEHQFKHTIAFIALLKSTRFDYISILTKDEHLPLRHLITTAEPELQTISIEAARVLLTLAPFLQLRYLQQDEKRFKELMKKTPALLKQFITDEIAKPRADMLDLVFYTKNRAENPDGQFDDRAPVFLRVIANITAAPDQASKIIQDETKNTKVFFGTARGQTTRIMEAMQTEFTTTPSLAYTARLRFSYAGVGMKEPAIAHTVEAINSVYWKRK